MDSRFTVITVSRRLHQVLRQKADALEISIPKLIELSLNTNNTTVILQIRKAKIKLLLLIVEPRAGFEPATLALPRPRANQATLPGLFCFLYPVFRY